VTWPSTTRLRLWCFVPSSRPPKSRRSLFSMQSHRDLFGCWNGKCSVVSRVIKGMESTVICSTGTRLAMSKKSHHRLLRARMDVSGRKQQTTSGLHDRQTSRSWLLYSLWSSLKRRVVAMPIDAIHWRYTLSMLRKRCSRYSAVQRVIAPYYFQRTAAKDGLACADEEQGRASRPSSVARATPGRTLLCSIV
jgi:hypothetical protein